METSSLEIIDQLFQMVTDAWGVPLGNEKCIIERDKFMNLLDELKTSLPVEIAEARRLVATRSELLNSAKKQAEEMLQQAQERSRRLVDEKEVVRSAKLRAAGIIAAAEQKQSELLRVATDFLGGKLTTAEDTLNEALQMVSTARSSFLEAMGVGPQEETAPETAEAPAEEKAPLPADAGDIVPDLSDEPEFPEQKF